MAREESLRALDLDQACPQGSYNFHGGMVNAGDELLILASRYNSCAPEQSPPGW
jgi:hypothetical protein